MKLSGQNFVACIGLLIMGLIFSSMAFESKLRWPLLALFTSRTAVATIAEYGTEFRTSRAGMTMTSYNFHYTFTVEGKDFGGIYASADLPTPTVVIRYLPSAPAINGNDLITHSLIDLFIFAVIFILVIGPVIAITLHFKAGTAVRRGG